MRNANKSSFAVFKSGNFMMGIAFAFGIILQLAVIEIPAARMVFTTANLTAFEWLITAVCSLAPLIWHEIVVIVKKIRNAKHA